MTVRTSWSSGEVLTAADLTDTFAAKAPLASPALTGTPTVNGVDISDLSGMVLIASQAFTAASSVSVNSCFTSAYYNYRIIWNATGTTQGGVTVRMRAGGNDNSTANYNRQTLGIVSTNLYPAASNGQTGWAFDQTLVGENNDFVLDLIAPQASAATRGFLFYGYRMNTSSAMVVPASVAHVASTSFDGITVSCGGATGFIRIYAYKN